jgi:hypothetical protein
MLINKRMPMQPPMQYAQPTVTPVANYSSAQSAAGNPKAPKLRHEVCQQCLAIGLKPEHANRHPRGKHDDKRARNWLTLLQSQGK